MNTTHRFAKLSYFALAAAIFFTSLRHVYRFGAPALLFNLISVALLLLLLWFRSSQRPVAIWLYTLIGAWVVTGFGIVDGLWAGALTLYGRYFFPALRIFPRSAPRPFGFEATAILVSAASVFAMVWGYRFMRATKRLLLAIVSIVLVIGGSAFGIVRKSVRNDDVVRIGVIVPTHGPAAPFGRAFVRAVEMAKSDRTPRRG